MKDELLRRIHEYGDKAVLVPISLLPQLQEGMLELNRKYELNDFQKYLANEGFTYELPEVDFTIRSILVVATSSPEVSIKFQAQGTKHTYLLPPTYCDYFAAPGVIEGYLKDLLETNNSHIILASKLPRKYLSALSGLAKYGRNNICYVEGLGCNINIVPFFTDIECEPEDLYEAKVMESCEDCKICIKNCPTQAIREEFFLIDNERCLTFMNEAGGDHEFPNWLNPLSHNAIVGCSVCQDLCPQNKKYKKKVIGPVEFDEEETQLILQGIKEEQLPDKMREKLVQVDLLGYLSSLPRNLRALLSKEKEV